MCNFLVLKLKMKKLKHIKFVFDFFKNQNISS
jgi:hypothetical protein